jgi:hypothetical protein
MHDMEDDMYFSDYHRVPNTNIQYRFRVGSQYTYISRVSAPEHELAITADEMMEYSMLRAKKAMEARGIKDPNDSRVAFVDAIASLGPHDYVYINPHRESIHSAAELCDCPNPRPGRPYHCAVVPKDRKE